VSAIFDQMGEKAKHLRLDWDHGAAAPQLERQRIERKFSEPVNHRPFPDGTGKIREISSKNGGRLQARIIKAF
jgi:hypothetical protein